ncbi:MAG TPA: DNA-3-methyladenine glycosylase I [Bacillota bacterium]
MSRPIRCPWPGNDPLYLEYHDREWGVPVYDDRKLLEFLILEGAQAGLSWITILKKRDNYRQAFDGFDPVKIAAYDENRIKVLLADEGIIRNRRKLLAAVQNARAFLELSATKGSFSEYLWDLAGGSPKQNAWRDPKEVPVYTREAERMSEELVRQGFKFVGPTICYSFMQAVGMVNDHLIDCFRYGEVKALSGLNQHRR